MRLPIPYRSETKVVSQHLACLSRALDWAAAAKAATPWVLAVRANPPPFWAMESLLKEYPISSAEGLALMRLAEALLRVPDAETAIALTADQLGRADFDSAGDKTLSLCKNRSHSPLAIPAALAICPPRPAADTTSFAPISSATSAISSLDPPSATITS